MARDRATLPTYPQKIACLILLAWNAGTPFICGICKTAIRPGQKVQFDHGHAVGRGGQNRVEDLSIVHAEKPGDADGFDCHNRKTAHPRGPHTSIGGDTHEAAKTPRMAEKAVFRKRERRLTADRVSIPSKRCRGCGEIPGACTCKPRPVFRKLGRR